MSSKGALHDELALTGGGDNDTAPALVAAIHSDEIDAVQRLVAGTPELARGPLGGPFKTRTALHVVCDWPGYFPNGAQIVRLLIAAGADPDYRPRATLRAAS